MATPGQLVRTMSEVLGISTGTVGQYDRQLAEAGLRSVSGRGSGAAKVAPADAANLLIAILGGGSSIREASWTCKRYGALEFDSEVSTPDGFELIGLVSLAKMPQQHTFREAITALIDGVGKGEIIHSDHRLWVQTTTFVISAAINGLGPPKRANLEYRPSFSDYVKDPDQFVEHKNPDLWQMRRVTFRTIHALGTLIAGRGA